ncbi:MAG: EamA family transporter [Rhodobacteraceae bacterium]|nr:EamA family transporter [Paracoccaceae bacterium]MBR27134.1 EamA family transporter [Paracoccaceae bacterium]
MRMSDRAWLYLSLLALIWGGGFVAVKSALAEMGPFASVFWRTGLGAASLWIAVAALRPAIPRDPGFWVACAVMGLLNNVIPFTLMAWGQQSIESGLTAILNAASAVFGAAVAAAILPDERMTPRRAVGIGLGVAGVAAITGPEALGGLDPRSLGQLAVLAGTLSYAFASVWGRLRLSGASPLVNAAGMTTMAFATMIPLTLWVEGPPPIALSPEAWGAALYFGVLGTGVAYLLYYALMREAGAANTMLVTLAIPPVAILAGWAALGERLSPGAYLGLGLIALGLAVMDGRALRGLRRPAPQRGRPDA